MCPTRARRRRRPTSPPARFRSASRDWGLWLRWCAAVSSGWSGSPRESGCRNSWFAILAPAGTPKDIIARLNAEVLKAVGDPEVRHKLEDLGFTVRGTSPDELGVLTQQQLAKYARVIKEMGIAIE